MHNAQLFQSAKIERERAEEAAALRERLVAIIGHDLRNPLAAISMTAQILSGSGLAARQVALVNRIQASVSRMARMISQILDFTRVRSGIGFELKFKSSNLHQICNAVVDELRISRPDRRIELHVEGDGAAVCDADAIAQVLSNIIGNALQHGTGGPISVKVGNSPSDTIAIAVHNFGSPIPEDAQASIFDAFHRKGTTGDHDSIGLGLFIASEIVRAHEGSITLRSADREGTTFTVLLPRRPAIADAESFPVHASDEPTEAHIAPQLP